MTLYRPSHLSQACAQKKRITMHAMMWNMPHDALNPLALSSLEIM